MRSWAIMAVTALALGCAQPAAAAPAPPPEQPPVVVTGQRPVLHKCGARDQVCVAAVIKQIWLDHPKEVREYCLKEEMRYNDQKWMLQSMRGPGDVGPVNADMPDSERQLCDYGRKHPKS